MKTYIFRQSQAFSLVSLGISECRFTNKVTFFLRGGRMKCVLLNTTFINSNFHRIKAIQPELSSFLRKFQFCGFIILFKWSFHCRTKQKQRNEYKPLFTLYIYLSSQSTRLSCRCIIKRHLCEIKKKKKYFCRIFNSDSSILM